MFNITVVGTCHCTFVPTHTMHNNTKREPKGKLGTVGDNDVSLLVHNKCATLVGHVDNGAGCLWGQEVYGNSLYLPLSCSLNLK